MEAYCEAFPELPIEELPVELLYEDWHVRRLAGADVSISDYVRRFPRQAAALQRLVGLNAAYESTAIFSSSGRSALARIRPGQRLDEFELLAELGQGAFARVSLARQASMQRNVALKVTANRGTEPQTLAQLDHDSIVRVYDVRVLEDRSLRLLYMQYVPGGTLQDVVRHVRQTPPQQRSGRLLLAAVDEALDKRGEFRPGESMLRERLAGAGWADCVCWLGAQLAEALDVAHRLQTLHRALSGAAGRIGIVR